jgi:hypothetical protein
VKKSTVTRYEFEGDDYQSLEDRQGALVVWDPEDRAELWDNYHQKPRSGYSSGKGSGFQMCTEFDKKRDARMLRLAKLLISGLTILAIAGMLAGCGLSRRNTLQCGEEILTKGSGWRCPGKMIAEVVKGSDKSSSFTTMLVKCECK